MAKRSAGIVLYRIGPDGPEVLLGHPGGPFWQNKRMGAWQISKGLVESGEEPLDAARREVAEELGITLNGDPAPLATIRQAGGKLIDAFALEQDVDIGAIRSNPVTLEWRRGSGRTVVFPEIDEARWFSLTEAEKAILASQRPLLVALREHLAARSRPASTDPENS